MEHGISGDFGGRRLTDSTKDKRDEEPGTKLEHFDNVQGCEQAEDDNEDDGSC